MPKLKKLISIISFIRTHPLTKRNPMLGVLRFFHWQLRSRTISGIGSVNWIEDSRLILGKNLHGASGNYYVGLLDFEEMALLIHFLRKGDIFIDVGANIGSYSILAAKLCGAEVYAFEPVRSTYELLKYSIKINEITSKTNLFNIGISDKKGQLSFTHDHDTINHVKVNTAPNSNELIEVDSLDNVVHINSHSFLKIDVEGFEQNVLKGSVLILKNSSLKCIIIELNGSGKKYGFEDSKTHEMLMECEFMPYQYDPINRKLSLLNEYNKTNNTIYIRDIDFVRSRIIDSKYFKINNSYI